MKIKIPQKLTLKHLNLITHIKGSDDISTEEMINFCADFCDVNRKDIEKASHASLLELFYTLADLFNEIKAHKEVRPSIKVNGKTYTFRDVSNNHPSSWWVTCQKELAKGIQAHQMMALCYIEEGLEFNDYDKKHKRKIINPYSDRCKEFEDAELIAEFIPLRDFFLSKYKKYKEPFLKLRAMRMAKSPALKTLSNRGSTATTTSANFTESHGGK